MAEILAHGKRWKINEYDIGISALCAWRENRGGGRTGMQSVLNVLVNRSQRSGASIAIEATRRYQFSSMTAPGDPQLVLYPEANDPQFATALALAEQAAQGQLADITGGATFYFADTMKDPPSWAASMTQTASIEGQTFFKEV